MMAGSKVTPSSAAAIAWREMPCAAASCLNAASQASKLPVLRQRGAAVRRCRQRRDRQHDRADRPKIRRLIAPPVRRIDICALHFASNSETDVPNVPFDLRPSS